MTMANTVAPSERQAALHELKTLRATLAGWLKESAYPAWASCGIDARNGGFEESLAQDGTALAQARRARVQPRQIYAFAQAGAFGWTGDSNSIVALGIEYFERFYRRPDGLFRTLAGTDGAPADDRALLYDQAFALLGYAAAATALEAHEQFEARALGFMQAIKNEFAAGGGAFRSTEGHANGYESNPHMHLLEACLAWAEIGTAPLWAETVQGLATLALTRFIRPDSGALGEAYGSDWRPASGLAGRLIEPCHQFEWACLLLRAGPQAGLASSQAAALRLLQLGEERGVRDRVAVNSLLDDFTVHDSNARCWPQTERLKASLLAARLSGDDRHWQPAVEAAKSLLPYLDTPVPGLWWDIRLSSGKFVE